MTNVRCQVKFGIEVLMGRYSGLRCFMIRSKSSFCGSSEAVGWLALSKSISALKT